MCQSIYETNLAQINKRVVHPSIIPPGIDDEKKKEKNKFFFKNINYDKNYLNLKDSLTVRMNLGLF